jgi:hypothetical protein
MSGRLPQARAASGITWQGLVLVTARDGLVLGPVNGRDRTSGCDEVADTTGYNRNPEIMARATTLGKFLRRPGVVGLLSGLVLFAALVGIRETGILQPLELEAYDLLLRLQQDGAAVTPRVTLLAITEADIQTLGRWPLPDATLAEMITALQAYRPDAIAIDIYRDLPVPPGSEQLEAVLAEHDNVFAVEKVGTNGAVGVPPPKVLAGTGQVGWSIPTAWCAVACCFSITALTCSIPCRCDWRCITCSHAASIRGPAIRSRPTCGSVMSPCGPSRPMTVATWMPMPAATSS